MQFFSKSDYKVTPNRQFLLSPSLEPIVENIDWLRISKVRNSRQSLDENAPNSGCFSDGKK